MQALAEQSRIVRLPLNKVGSLNKINKAFSNLEQEFEREPSAEELAEMLEITREEVETTLGVAARHISVDAPFQEGEENSLLMYWKTRVLHAPICSWNILNLSVKKSNALYQL